MNDTSRQTGIDKYVLEAVVGLGLLLVGLLGVLLPALGVAGVRPLMATTRRVQLDAVTSLPGNDVSGPVVLRGTDHAELVFATPDLVERLLIALPGVAGNLLLVMILAVLLRIARTFRDGDFFVPGNAPRLLAVAVAVALSGLLVPLLDMITTNLLTSGTAAQNSVRTVVEFDVNVVLLGILVAAVSVAFRSGSRLRDDTDGLV
jgi:hypothetical protein